jgi:hypothetical protein
VEICTDELAVRHKTPYRPLPVALGGESWGSRAGRAPCYRGRLLPLLFLSQIVRFWLILWLQRASDSSQDSVKSDLL